MNLEKHIVNLLYHHDCVVVPNFGAFIAQKRPAFYQKETASFLPPQKVLAFNPSITQNDGVLIQALCQAEGCNYETAQEAVESNVLFWNQHLDRNSSLNLIGLGNLSKDENGLLQFQAQHANFLLETFGLDSVQVYRVLPEIQTDKSTAAIWWKTAALVPVLLGGFLYFGKPQPVTDFVNQQWSGFVSPVLNPNLKALEAVESPIKLIEKQAETFKEELIVENTIHANQVIAGAFRKMEEADDLVKILTEKGFDKAAFTQKKGKFHYVAFETFSTKEAANDFRRAIANEFPDAWVLTLEP